MNVKLLLAFFILLSIPDISSGRGDRRKECKLEQKIKRRHRSIIEQPIHVFLDEFYLNIEQESSTGLLSYTATIKDISTGEIIQTLTTTGDSYFDISHLLSGEYYIEIDLKSMLLCGSFFIQ